MSVMDNYKRITDDVAEIAIKCERNPKDITILAVSKTQSFEKMIELGKYGVRIFGESKVQEALPKIERIKELWNDSVFHFIGKFQTNKALKIAANFELVQSVDRIEAAEALSSAANKAGKIISALIQINLAGETQKNGVYVKNLEEVLEYTAKDVYINLAGFMMIPPLEDAPETNRKYFKMSREIFDKYKKSYPSMKILSMGMSGDYRIAIEEGSTLLRIGTSIFGER